MQPTVRFGAGEVRIKNVPDARVVEPTDAVVRLVKMQNVIILGASGNIAKHVIDILVKKDDINLTLFLRDARRLVLQL
jgi:hypothetical protein